LAKLLRRPQATEALDDGLRAVKHTAKQRLNELEDRKDDAAIRVRKAPLATVTGDIRRQPSVRRGPRLVQSPPGLRRGRRQAAHGSSAEPSGVE
jgi:hypothetical protein